MRSTMMVFLMVVALAGCESGEGESTAARPSSSVAAESMATPEPPTPEPAPEPAPPTALEVAQTALGEERYRDVCDYLVSEGVSSVMCDWILETIEHGGDRALSQNRYRRFLREQHVRRVRGRINGWYDEGANEYEARIGGRTAILVARETTFQTTGGFSMWVQERGASEEELNSGRIVNVSVYREWPLHESIQEFARLRGAAAVPGAVGLLRELLRGWNEDYCFQTDPLAIECDGTRPIEEVVAERTTEE